MSEEIIKKIAVVDARIKAACQKIGRDPKDVRLLLATKTVPAEHIKVALQAGKVLIAENKVQEIKEKYDALLQIPHEAHFIGHLQSNKIKDILKYGISCIQSLDSIDIAEKLHQRLLFENKTIEVLIQINTSNEESKFGSRPEDAIELIQKISEFSTIRIKGLMTIGLFSGETEKVRRCFQLLRDVRDQVKALKVPGVKMKELSMGMSGDLETAIEEGATIVRVGTAIFGQRIYPDSYYWNENN